MDRDTWYSLPKADQDVWDKIDGESKTKILSYAMKKAAKATESSLSINQAETHDSDSSPGASNDDSIVFECSNLEICESEATPTASPVVESQSDTGVEMVKSPPLKSILKTADAHNADLLLLKNEESTPKTQQVTIQEPKDSPSESKKKGPTPPIKSDDPVTDGLHLLSDNDKGKKEPFINPTALEIHKMLSVKPLSDAEKAARVREIQFQPVRRISSRVLRCQFLRNRHVLMDFTPMICNAEMECDNNVEVEISMAEQFDPDDQDDFLSFWELIISIS